jgi:hypothetical protein
MLRVGIENGKLFLTADFLARDALDGRLQQSSRRATSRKDQRFEPIDDLVAVLDLHAALAVAI